ncbi:MAG: cytochrome c biogenesis protein CcsA [Polyangiaceae bacterium]|nr:cytochrome c biogenesis protein CcsA [Polyangiaceae bacterium]
MYVTLAEIAFFFGVAAYLGATVLSFTHLARRTPPHRGAAWLLGAGGAGHLGYLLFASLLAGVCPVESVHVALSAAVLVTIGAYLATRARFRLDAVGAFVAPIALAFLLGTRIVGLDADARGRIPPMLLTLHVAANLVGVALFLLASVTAGLYLYAERQLKHKRSRAIAGRLPPLDALDRAEHRFLLVGFPMLTLGIVTGTAWAHKLEAGTPSEVLRAALGYLAWALFAGVLLLRAGAGWRGRRAAVGTLLGFAVSVLVVCVYLVRQGAPS